MINRSHHSFVPMWLQEAKRANKHKAEVQFANASQTLESEVFSKHLSQLSYVASFTVSGYTHEPGTPGGSAVRVQ